jgi:hypothetical protein
MALQRQAVDFIHRLRGIDLFKAPGIAEAIDWCRALAALGVTELDPQSVRDTLGVLLKYQDDLARADGPTIAELLAGAPGRLTMPRAAPSAASPDQTPPPPRCRCWPATSRISCGCCATPGSGCRRRMPSMRWKRCGISTSARATKCAPRWRAGAVGPDQRRCSTPPSTCSGAIPTGKASCARCCCRAWMRGAAAQTQQSPGRRAGRPAAVAPKPDQPPREERFTAPLTFSGRSAWPAATSKR